MYPSIFLPYIIMKKTLLIGLATIAIAGSAIIGSSIYAASGTTGNANTGMHHMMRGMGQNGSENRINSLSGKVSTEALTALETLMKKHQTEMETLRSSSTTPDTTTMEAKRTEFKTEMDALVTKYPELKTAMPTHMEGGKGMGRHGGRDGGEFGPMSSVISSLTADEQAKVKTIRESYKTKMDSLRTQEKTEIEAVISGNATAKAKYVEIEKNRPTQRTQSATAQ